MNFSYESGKYEYPKNDYGSPSSRLLPLDALSLSEDGSLASGGAARSFRPHPLSSQFSVQSQNCQTPAYRYIYLTTIYRIVSVIVDIIRLL